MITQWITFVISWIYVCCFTNNSVMTALFHAELQCFCLSTSLRSTCSFFTLDLSLTHSNWIAVVTNHDWTQVATSFVVPVHTVLSGILWLVSHTKEIGTFWQHNLEAGRCFQQMVCTAFWYLNSLLMCVPWEIGSHTAAHLLLPCVNTVFVAVFPGFQRWL